MHRPALSDGVTPRCAISQSRTATTVPSAEYQVARVIVAVDEAGRTGRSGWLASSFSSSAGARETSSAGARSRSAAHRLTSVVGFVISLVADASRRWRHVADQVDRVEGCTHRPWGVIVSNADLQLVPLDLP